MYRKTRKPHEVQYTDYDKQCLAFADYIITHKATIRTTAKAFNVGKSGVHNAVVKRLPRLNRPKYLEVRKILDYNKSVKHLRGGEATKQKFAAMSNEEA